MKPLSQHLEDYLRLRHQLGYKMQDAEKLLRNFVRFAGQEGAKIITTKLALRGDPTEYTETTECHPLGDSAAICRLYEHMR